MASAPKRETTLLLEKAMYHAHGISYKEYFEDFQKQIKVEQLREKDYQEELQFVAKMNYKAGM